jgi:hypothetical protein
MKTTKEAHLEKYMDTDTSNGASGKSAIFLMTKNFPFIDEKMLIFLLKLKDHYLKRLTAKTDRNTSFLFSHLLDHIFDTSGLVSLRHQENTYIVWTAISMTK